MSNKNEVFEYLIDQLRQQVNNNQCEYLAREVLSLKNQLRDATALVAEFHKDNIKKSEHISHLTGQVKELHLALAEATGDVPGVSMPLSNPVAVKTIHRSHAGLSGQEDIALCPAEHLSM